MAAEKTSPKDYSLWALALLVFAGGIVGYNYFSGEVMALVRVIGLLAAVGVALFLAGQTLKGRELFAFFREADVERRKVVWPTRQETLHTALMVLVTTVFLGLILFGLDRLWGWIVHLLISPAGGG